MDNNIIETVYNSLDAKTDDIIGMGVQCKEIDKKINSGRYSQKTIDTELKPKLFEANQKYRKACDDALNEARELVAQYRADAAEEDKLNPAELTDDVKLMQSGIILKPRDIEGMLKRNEGNKTMTQIILRYAEENKIDTGRVHYIGAQEYEETARGLDQIIHYYGRWIDKPNSKEMLRKFFGIDDDEE